MQKQQLVAQILTKLKPFAPQGKALPQLGKRSFNYVSLETLVQIRDILKHPPTTPEVRLPRPECPVTRGGSAGGHGLAFYKSQMAEYLAQFGVYIHGVNLVPFTVYEAIANYLEQEVVKGEL
ncbi:hypothetical protein DRJ48_03835 [Candidatus Woesearchaeota archaeon]|nr:hypothetical protein [Candidatus Woesearchaeota archaeon]RLE42281.1 MAG: hypothetical protein DRJ48_03835 [Candidatus Woesearchaeota archaeon]